MKLDELIALYKTTVFITEVDTVFPSAFAIITACNPRNHVLSAKDNATRNRMLEQAMGELAYFDIIGASPDLSYQEPSFAVDCKKDVAIKLAKQFEQNAIFWVENDQLSIVPVCLKLEHKDSIQADFDMGRFSDRVRKAM